MARHIYVHIPFCERKCPYCDFYSVDKSTMDEALYNAYLDEIRIMADLMLEDHNPDMRDTVYIGGGTPSAVDAEFIFGIITEIRERFHIRDNAEITIECNPNSLNVEKALAYADAGVNRVSLGVQSLTDGVLKVLGRLHDADKALTAIETVRSAGIENISCDLITAVPGQTMENLLEDAGKLIDHGVDHISTYALTIEEGTPFYGRYKDNIEDLVSPDLEREMYHSLRAFLRRKGIIPYEISNNARTGSESIHNSSYWEGYEYFGIGPGAHGYLNSVRYCHNDDIASFRDLSYRDYRDFFESKSSFDRLSVEEVLDFEAKMKEYPYLKLRTSSGIDLNYFKKRFGRDFQAVFADALKSNVSKGFLAIFENRVFLTSRGLDMANQVFSDFI